MKSTTPTKDASASASAGSAKSTTTGESSGKTHARSRCDEAIKTLTDYGLALEKLGRDWRAKLMDANVFDSQRENLSESINDAESAAGAIRVVLATIEEQRSLEDVFIHLARLALAGTPKDVELLIRKTRKRCTSLAMAGQLSELLRDHPTQLSPLRS